MTITTKTNANGRISGYYVDGEKVRKNEIDGIISNRRNEIITVDYYDGLEFRTLTRSADRRLKVVFVRDDDKIIMTQAAADQLGYRIIKKFTGNYSDAYLVEKTEVTDDERNEILSTPLVSAEAFDIAVAAEIELAEVKTRFLVDILVEKGSIIRNRVEKSKFFAKVQDAAEWILGYANDGDCKVIRAKISDWQNDVEYKLTDLDIEYANGKDSYEKVSQVYGLKTTTASNGKVMWFYYGDRISADVAAHILAEFGYTIEQYLADTKIADNYRWSVIRPRDYKIFDQADFLAEKIWGESKPLDDDDDVFDLLPDVDELNDVEGFDEDLVLPTLELDETIYFTPIGNEFRVITVGEENVHFFNGQLFLIRSLKYRARWQDGSWFVSLGDRAQFKSDEEFFQIMAKRGACTIDEPEPPVDDYDSKRQERIAHHQLVSKWNAELADLKAGLSKMSGKHQKRGVLGTYKLEFGLYVTTTTDECKYLLKVASLPIATYDTPAQVDKVIDILRAAIERGDKEFKFPTIDELSQEHWDSACDNMPQDYLDAIVAQTMPRKKREPITDAELIANGDELKALEGRIMGRDFPRFEQPRFDAPLVDWYREYQFRADNPFWWESEYHYNDDGTLIHAKR